MRRHWSSGSVVTEHSVWLLLEKLEYEILIALQKLQRLQKLLGVLEFFPELGAAGDDALRQGQPRFVECGAHFTLLLLQFALHVVEVLLRREFLLEPLKLRFLRVVVAN